MTLRPPILCALVQVQAQAAETRKLNLLFILTEDQGAQRGFVGTPMDGVSTDHATVDHLVP